MILYFENSGDSELNVSYEGPGVSLQALGNNSLYRLSPVITSVPEKMNSNITNIFPNPSFGIAEVDFYSENEEPVYFQIFDLASHLVWSEVHQAVAGHNSMNLALGNIQEGTYFVNMTRSRETRMFKIALAR